MLRKQIEITLDTEKPNTLIPKTFLQGSADEELLITLNYDSKEETVSDTAVIELNFIYGYNVQNEVISFMGMSTLKQGDNGFDVSVLNGKLLVKVSPYMTGYYGTNAIVLKIIDGVTTYNYSATYKVDQNPAFRYSEISDKFIPFEATTVENRNIIDIIEVYKSVTTAMTGFKDLPNGYALYKQDGVVKTIGIHLDEATNTITMPYAIKVTPNTLYLGENINIHENGGFVENQVSISGKKYLMLDYLNDSVNGTSKPIYYKRGALNENLTDPIEIQSDFSVQMDNLTHVDYGFERVDMQVQNVYFDFRTAVTNFRFRVTANGVHAAYYPSKAAWDGIEPGFNINSGKQRIALIPWFSSLTDYNIQFDFLADQEINLLGNGTLPYIAVDRNKITQIELATMEDLAITGGGDTPQEIKTKLETLTGDDRLDASAIKNIPSSGAKTLLELTDTPDSYVGKGGKIVRVKNDETGISFDTPPDFALPDLSNVSAEDLKKATVAAGMLQQDLEDVDLNKLKEKVSASGANLITVGELHGDYHEGAIKEIDFHNGLDVTIDAQNKIASISLSPDMAALPGEVARLKTDIGDKALPTYTYRGNAIPTLPTTKQKAYYVSFNALKDSLQVLQLPANVDDGTIFSIDNNDANDSLFIQPQQGETINNIGGNRKINAESILFLIKKGANWAIGFDGYMPNTLDRMVSDIKTELTGSLNTIAEIQAQLKDRLHTFREIQSEFANQLHSPDAIEQLMTDRGFSKGSSVGYGTLTSNIAPINDSWISAYIAPNAEVLLPAVPNQQVYVAVFMPNFLTPLVKSLRINNALSDFDKHDYVRNENLYNVLITKTKYDASNPIRLTVDYGESLYDNNIVYGVYSSDQTPTPENWVIGNMHANQETFLAIYQDQKYVYVAIPSHLEPLKYQILLNDTPVDTTSEDIKINSHSYVLYKTTTSYNLSSNVKVGVNYAIKETEITFKDGLTGQDFTATKIQSADKSIRISNLNGVADFSKGTPDHNEGIHVCLGTDELINSRYGRSKLYFSDTRVKGGMFVYPDTNTKSFVIQDTDPTDDPNVSGGTTFIVALYYEPNPDEENKVTQDGKIVLELVDDNDTPITGTDGNPMGVVIDYKANDIVKPELYIGECQATAFTRVHLKIDLQFANEEIISVGANTQLCIQSINKDESSGLALLSFMAFTGYQIAFDTKYYGYNSLNMAQFLTFDVPEAGTNAQQMSFGNNTFLDFKNNAKLSISNNHLTIKDDGVNLPVWTIIKLYDKVDSHSIGGKSYKVTATLTDKDDAYRVSLMEYTGNANPVPLPTVLRYDNQNPVFTSGWVQRDSMFISEDAVSGDHTQTQTFTMPVDAKSLAIIMYHAESQIPVNLLLKDLEGDITPWFNRVIITDNSHIKEKYLVSKDGVYRGITKTPNGDLAYRYTVNSTDTKLPVGVVSGDDGNIVNDNSWTDPGSIDPNKVQGDLKFLTDGKVTMSYTARCFNEQNRINQIQFWLAKNVGGVFTEVTNSRTATTIEAQRTKPKMVSSFKFSFDVKANETYRMFGKSDNDDGFYLQSNLDGVPLLRLDIEFDEFTAEEKALSDRITYLEQSANEIRFMTNGQEVYNKMLEYDTTTGRMKVVDKI